MYTDCVILLKLICCEIGEKKIKYDLFLYQEENHKTKKKREERQLKVVKN